MEAFKALPNPPAMKLIEDHEQQRAILGVSRRGAWFDLENPEPTGLLPGWEDSAVDPKRLGDYLRRFQQMLDEYGYKGSIYGHFGQACVHVSIDFDLFTAAGIAKYREFVTKMAHICVEHGGSLSGEHGDGQARGELLPIMYGDELVQAFWEFKSIWDPENKMNPGKVVHPYKLDENLRWGTELRTLGTRRPISSSRTITGASPFAANRCVGTGQVPQTRCRNDVPELHGNEGRGLLDPRAGPIALRDARRQPDAKRLAGRSASKTRSTCACRARAARASARSTSTWRRIRRSFFRTTTSARRRPIAAYAFGLMYWWARLASLAPGVVNALTQTPALRDLAKAVVSIAPQRRIPLFAPQTFRAWFARATALETVAHVAK